jgi:hypothetical protein
MSELDAQRNRPLLWFCQDYSRTNPRAKNG